MEALENDLLLGQLTDSYNNIKTSGMVPVPDDNKLLMPFFEVLEILLMKGLKKGLGLIGLKDYSYWNWIEGLRNSTKLDAWVSPKVGNIIYRIERNIKLRRSIGRGRQFLRVAFQSKELSTTLLCFINSPKYVRHWYQEPSLFLCRDQIDTLMKVVESLESLGLSLNLETTGFLDESFEIPVCQHLELVPCRMLGIAVSTLQGRAVVTSVKPNTTAAENNFAVGDCLEEYAGQFITEKYTGRIAHLHLANQGLPIKCTLVKGRHLDGTPFGPLQTRCAHLIPYQQSHESTPVSNGNTLEAGFLIRYLGSSSTGKLGGLQVIQKGMREIIDSSSDQAEDVKMMLVERDVVIISIEKKQIKSRHSFTTISACGLCEFNPLCFGIIVGNTSCSVADKFTCHVFRATTNKIICCTCQLRDTDIGNDFDAKNRKRPMSKKYFAFESQLLSSRRIRWSVALAKDLTALYAVSDSPIEEHPISTTLKTYNTKIESLNGTNTVRSYTRNLLEYLRGML